jgi:phage host-nuclease inhibitor protein Gam
MANRAKAPARPTSVQDREALIKAIARAGELQRKRAAEEAYTEELVAGLKAALAKDVLPIDEELARITKDVQAYCEANKLALLPDGFKSVNVGTGDLGWRADPPSVKHLGKVEQAVMMLKAIQLSQFVRVEESLNKDALLAFRRTALAAKDDETGQITKRSWAALTECGAVKFSTGKEKFWFTPATVEAPVVVATGEDEVVA